MTDDLARCGVDGRGFVARIHHLTANDMKGRFASGVHR
jgi:hypothetical protein